MPQGQVNMVNFSSPHIEVQQLSHLKDNTVLDMQPESIFDDITQLALEVCKTPVAFISFLDGDKQWFKSVIGIQLNEPVEELAFCKAAIASKKDILVVNDARKDKRFANNPYVINEPKVVFYAGVPLITPGGVAIGTLCVLDFEPKTMTERQSQLLVALGRQVLSQVELKKKNATLKSAFDELLSNFEEGQKNSIIAAHDLRSPLHNIISLIHFYIDENKEFINEEGMMYLTHVKTCSYKLSSLIDGLLSYEKNTRIITAIHEEFDCSVLIKEVIEEFSPEIGIKFSYPKRERIIFHSKNGLKQVLRLLIGNAIKEVPQPGGKINIACTDVGDEYLFTITDNGNGFHENDLPDMFELFNVLKMTPMPKSGVGIPAAKRLLDKMGSSISLTSKAGKETTFSFRIRK